MAATNKCLARINKSSTEGKATMGQAKPYRQRGAISGVARRPDRGQSGACLKPREGKLSSRITMKRILFATISTLVLTSSVNAAEITCIHIKNMAKELFEEEPCGIGRGQIGLVMGILRGAIVNGDYEKIKSWINPNTFAFELMSPGGNVDEALKIGRLLRKYEVDTEAAYNRPPCASACALIWFGGITRSGKVGLHRPFFDDPAYKRLPLTDASTVYNRMLKDVKDYLQW
jgi:hypothetical protein